MPTRQQTEMVETPNPIASAPTARRMASTYAPGTETSLMSPHVSRAVQERSNELRAVAINNAMERLRVNTNPGVPQANRELNSLQADMSLAPFMGANYTQNRTLDRQQREASTGYIGAETNDVNASANYRNAQANDISTQTPIKAQAGTLANQLAQQTIPGRVGQVTADVGKTTAQTGLLNAQAQAGGFAPVKPTTANTPPAPKPVPTGVKDPNFVAAERDYARQQSAFNQKQANAARDRNPFNEQAPVAPNPNDPKTWGRFNSAPAATETGNQAAPGAPQLPAGSFQVGAHTLKANGDGTYVNSTDGGVYDIDEMGRFRRIK